MRTVTSNKERRKQVVSVDKELNIEFRNSIAALILRHGRYLDVPVSEELLVSCSQIKNGMHLLYVRVTLKDGTVIDPCIIYPSEVDPLKYLSRFPYFVAGGSIEKVERSPYMLPLPIIEKASESFEYRMGSFEPVLISIHHERKYLVPAFSIFLSVKGCKGGDVDSIEAVEPDVNDYRKGKYLMGDPMTDRITIAVGDLRSVIWKER